LEILSLSLNNSKGFSKKVMIFSEFQVFRIIAPGLVDNAFDPRSEENKFIPGCVSLDRQGQWGSIKDIVFHRIDEMLRWRCSSRVTGEGTFLKVSCTHRTGDLGVSTMPAPADADRVDEPEVSEAANILVDLVQGILQEVNLLGSQVVGDSLPQVLGQGHEALLKLLAFLGEVNTIFPSVPGIGLAKDEAFLLQGVDHPGDVRLVFRGFFGDFPLGEAVFLPEMPDDGPLLRSNLEAVLFEEPLQGRF
jgi:hypothetical protein